MKLGIVGLPNVGKSTLFNAITKAGAEAANYPFCTIEPNVGVVTVPDERLKVLHEMYNSKKTIYTTIEFYDIAGLVKGASKGEGLGNKFLGHIREVAAIVHVVRCFEDPNVVHVDGKIDLGYRYHQYGADPFRHGSAGAPHPEDDQKSQGGQVFAERAGSSQQGACVPGRGQVRQSYGAGRR